jgi:hypothetical protein
MIEKWYKFVNANNTDAIRLLAIAQNKIYHKSYSEIIPLLRNFEFDLTSKIRALGMLSIAYYEEDNMDFLHDHLLNFERTLKRNKSKLSKSLFLSYKNFIVLLKILMQARIEKERVDISEYKYLIFRPWINEKFSV